MILDQHGSPISTAQLKGELATPSRWGVRQYTGQYNMSGMDPLRLARVLKAAEQGEATAYLELAEEMEEKYLHYGAQMATRKRAVTGIKAEVRPASEKLRDRKIAEFVSQAIPTIQAATFDMLDAVGKGYSATEIIWDTSGSQWMIGSLEYRDPRWFQYDEADGRTLLMKSDTHPAGEPLPPGKFIIHQAASKSGLPIRGGMARGAAWAYLFHNFSLRDWVIFCQDFGKPLRLGRYEAGASPADLAILFDAVSSLGSDAAAMLPKSMEIEFPEVANARGDAGLWSNLLDYLDRQVSKLVLGQTLTADTGKGGGGSYALGKVHNDVRLDILYADAKALAMTINRDLIPLLVNLNFAGVSEYPEYHLPVEEPDDLVALADIVEKAVGMGQPVSAHWFSERFGIPLPQAGEPLMGRKPEPVAAHRASHTQEKPAPDPSDKSLAQLTTQAQTQVEAWSDDIATMLDRAESLEEFREQLLTRYQHLPAEALVTVMATALAAINLRGRAEVEAEQ